MSANASSETMHKSALANKIKLAKETFALVEELITLEGLEDKLPVPTSRNRHNPAVRRACEVAEHLLRETMQNIVDTVEQGLSSQMAPSPGSESHGEKSLVRSPSVPKDLCPKCSAHFTPEDIEWLDANVEKSYGKNHVGAGRISWSFLLDLRPELKKMKAQQCSKAWSRIVVRRRLEKAGKAGKVEED